MTDTQTDTGKLLPCLFEEDVRGLTCCERGRIGDGHGCYAEALHQQKRKDKVNG